MFLSVTTSAEGTDREGSEARGRQARSEGFQDTKQTRQSAVEKVVWILRDTFFQSSTEQT